MQTMAPPEDALTERFARIDERFDEVNRRITEDREETRQRFDRLEAGTSERFDRLEAGTSERFDRLEAGTSERFDRVEGDFAGLKKGLESLQATLNRISIGLALGFASALIAILAKGG